MLSGGNPIGVKMSFAYWMVLLAAVLPYVTVGLAKAFAPFAAAVIIAHLASVPAAPIDLLAGLFIVARIAYTVAYLADRATLRSLIWVIGVGCVVTLFVIAAMASPA